MVKKEINMQERSKHILKSSRMIFDEESRDIFSSDVNYLYRELYHWEKDFAYPVFPTYLVETIRDDNAWLQHFNYHLCSIELCLGGTVEYRTDTERFVIAPGEVFIMVPHSNVMIRNGEPGKKRHKLTLLSNGNNCTVMCQSLGFDRAMRLVPRDPEEIERRIRHIGKLIRENGSHRSASEELYSLMLLLAEEKRESERNIPSEMFQLITFLNNNFYRHITVTEMAGIQGCSPATLRRKFMASFNLSPMKYLSCLRLKNSAGMLKNSNLPIKEVGFRCGFETPLHFTRSFREFFKCTPSEFRRYSNKEK